MIPVSEEWKDKTDDVMESGHSEAEMFTEADIFSCCQMIRDMIEQSS